MKTEYLESNIDFITRNVDNLDDFLYDGNSGFSKKENA